ncbi:MAG: response regulator transcription factor [Kofleriaceae bacterium]
MSKVRDIRSVLVVDDDEVYLTLFARSGTRAPGIDVFTARSVHEGREVARTERPDLAIVDLQLGRESGIDLVRTLKAELPTTFITVCTAYASTEITVAAMRAGADDVVHKSSTMNEILLRAEDPGILHAEPQTLSLELVEWEHVTRVVSECGGDLSEAARLLRVDRSSLQTFLGRPAPTS